MRTFTEDQKLVAEKKRVGYVEKLKAFPKGVKGLKHATDVLYFSQASRALGEQLDILGDEEGAKKCYNDAILAISSHSDIVRKIKDPTVATEIRNIYRHSYRCLAYHSFHAYLCFTEMNFDPTRRFYADRFCVLKDWVTELQGLEDGKYDLLGISAPPRTGKSGVESFYISWLLGRHPEKSILFATHTNGMAEKIRDDVYNILTDEKRGWRIVFPGLQVDKSAERNWIDISPKDYPNNYKSIYFRGIDQSMAGVLEASHMIICDDLIRGIEEAMNPARLEAAWQKYGTDISQRRTSDAVKELHIATRWSINDPLTRLEDINRGNERAKFIVKPGLNEKGESNFMYKYHPMTKEHFERLREHMDDVSFECIVQQNPMERDGIVFPKDSLSYYEGELPDGEPDEIVFATDVAFGGGDFTCMPIAYVYDMDVFIHDVVFSNGAKETVKPLVCKAIIDNNCSRGFFESNNGGDDYAADIDKRLKSFGYRCHIESKRALNTKSKLARILDCESEIKGRITDGSGYVFHFLSPNARAGKPMYQAYIKQLCRFNQTAKFQGKQHDDAADATSSLVYNVLNRRRVSGSIQSYSRRILNL